MVLDTIKKLLIIVLLAKPYIFPILITVLVIVLIVVFLLWVGAKLLGK
jgi:hypothetical protein